MTSASQEPLFSAHERRLESLIERFERDWQAGARLPIADYLAEHGHDLELLSELLHVDIEYRFKAGELPDLQEYLADFPQLHQDAQRLAHLRTWHAQWRERIDQQAEQTLVGPLETADGPAIQPLTGAEATLLQVGCPQCRATNYLPPGVNLQAIVCQNCEQQFSWTPAAQTLEQYRHLGKYELRQQVGQGAFGIVYRAHDLELDRVVAVKIARNGQNAARFLSEARKAARLQHPLIVTLHDSGCIDGVPFIVSEFVEGKTLEEHVRSQPLDEREVAELVSMLAETIDYAHRRGIVHRDLKPANIMLQPLPPDLASRDSVGIVGSSRIRFVSDLAYVPRIMDFGLALRNDSESLTSIRRPGRVLGTAAYMSPEQARGDSDSADGRSDVYSLGVILFRLLTGELPFRGNLQMTVHQVLNEEPPPLRRLNDNIARDLETVTLKCLAKDPQRRFPNGIELAKDLRRWLEGMPIESRPITRSEKLWRWCLRNRAVASLSACAALMVMLLICLSIGFGVYQSRAAARLRREQVHSNQLLISQFADRAHRRSLENRPDEALLYWARVAQLAEPDAPEYVSLAQTQLASYRQKVSELQAVWPLPSPAIALAASDDGRRLAVAEAGGRVRVAATGESSWRELQSFQHPGEVTSLTFTADADRLLSTGAEGVRLWGTSNGRALLRLEHEGARIAAHSAATGIIVTASQNVRLWDDKTGELLASFAPNAAASCMALDPSGQNLWIGGETGRVQHWEIKATNGRWSPRWIRDYEHPQLVSALAVDDKRLWVGASDGVISTWRLGAEQPDDTFATGHGPVRELRPAAGLALTQGADGAAKLWDLAKRQPVGQPLEHPQAVTVSVLDHAGQHVLSAGREGSLRYWRVARGSPAAALPHASPVMACVFIDSDTLLTAATDGVVRRWNTTTSQCLAESPPQPAPIVDLQLYAPANRYFTLDAESHLQLFDLQGAPLGPRVKCSDIVLRAIFGQNPDRVLVLTANHDIQRCDLKTGSVSKLPTPANACSLVLQRRQHALILGDRSGHLCRFDLERDAVSSTGAAAELLPHDLFLDSSGNFLAASDRDRAICVLHAADLKPVGPVIQAPVSVRALAFGPQGSRFATAGTTSIQLWDTSTLEAVGLPLPHADVQALAFHPDGRLLFTASVDGRVRGWDLATGLQLGPELQRTEPVDQLLFSPDGKQLLCMGGNSATLSPLPAFSSMDSDLMRRKAEQWTGLKLDSNGRVVPTTADAWLADR